MNPILVGDVSNELCILIGSVRIGTLCRYISDTLTVLALVSSDHVNWLLKQVKIEILIRRGGTIIEVPIDEGLGILLLS